MLARQFCVDKFLLGENIPSGANTRRKALKDNGAIRASAKLGPRMLAKDIIANLKLTPHPEGGWYRQTWVAGSQNGQRPTGTAIYYLLEAGQKSHWHHVDAEEIWHFYAGVPLILSISAKDTGPAVDHRLGPNVLAGESPQILVPKSHWQAARSTGNWTLVGCTVSPAFQFDGFKLASDDFDIPRA